MADGTGTGGTEWGALPIQLSGVPIYTRVQRLTNSQYEHSVTDILGFDAPANLSENFRIPIVGITDFTNNELVLTVGDQEVIDYEAAAEAAAALATSSDAALQALHPEGDAEGFIQSFGRRAFRRPLTSEEEARYLEVFELGESLYGAGFENGAAMVIRAILQSPHFLYRTELGPEGEALGGYELAAKLSLWLLDTTPSDELLERAAAGELDTLEGVENTALDMLSTLAAVGVMQSFHEQLYHLGRLLSIQKDDIDGYSEATNQELIDVSRAFFDSVFTDNEGLREILTSTRGYAGPELAPIYGAEVDEGLVELDLGPERTGYFMQVPYLMLHSEGSTPDPIHRGVGLLENVLCNSIPPPPDVTPELPPAEEGQTNRERVAAGTAGCGSPCHDVYINPLGFAFENFDGMGQLRQVDNGQPIDTSGSYPLESGVVSFGDARELMQILAESSQAHLCYAKKMAGYGLGRDIVEDDMPLLEGLSEVSYAGSLADVVLALVRDPAFRVRQGASQ